MNSALKILRSLVIALFGLAAARGVQAQQVVRLIEFTNVWKFNDSGADLGTAWREPAYDDSTWPSGPGMFGVETNLPPPYPIPLQTPMALGSPAVVTFYLRTHFQYDGGLTTTGTALRARVFVDDACAVYLNGTEAGRIRLQSNADYRTFGVGTYEGTLDWFEFPRELLVTGNNTLAVEVHQNQAIIPPDVAFGMRLDAIVPQPLVITRQPLDQTSIIPLGASPTNSSPAFFRVESEGGPVSFQWRKDGTNLPNAQLRYLSIPTPGWSDVGDYSVVLSNALGEITSATARLTLVDQNSTVPGPRLVSAKIRISSVGTTSQIDIRYLDVLQAATATAVSNYTVWKVGAGDPLSVLTAQYSHPVVRLNFAHDLDLNQRYAVTVNNVKDLAGVAIAPNSQVPVASPFTTMLIGSNSLWRYHSFATQDVSILDARWYEPGYVENSYWREGITTAPRPYQKQADLFRIPFVWPDSIGVIEKMALAFRAAPYPVFWLNGNEIYRYPIASEFPPWPSPIDVNTRSASSSQATGEISISRAMILPGTNWLAAGVFHHVDGGYDPPSTGPSVFSATLAINYLLTADLPEGPPPQLTALPIALGQYQVSWMGGGYALETATNIVTVGTNTIVGPWLPVPDMANPYTVTVNPDEPLRLFRLRK